MRLKVVSSTLVKTGYCNLVGATHAMKDEISLSVPNPFISTATALNLYSRGEIRLVT